MKNWRESNPDYFKYDGQDPVWKTARYKYIKLWKINKKQQLKDYESNKRAYRREYMREYMRKYRLSKQENNEIVLGVSSQVSI